jgi:crossover junction endodeoxyribonuclease RusA
VEPWREAIKYAARRALVDPTEPHIWQPFDGPIQLDVLFRLPRPKSAPKRRWAPAGRPDLDKCVRAVCDALTDAGVWRDDSRVVDLNARKRYAIVSPPGADITISEVVS